jgi:hypothetical protein
VEVVRQELAVIGFYVMALLLVMAGLSFVGGFPRAGGVMVALAALCMAGSVTLIRNK